MDYGLMNVKYETIKFLEEKYKRKSLVYKASQRLRLDT